jgi:anti-anti-sigma factor
MAQQNSRVKVSTVGDVTVVELVDKKLLDEMNIRQIETQLYRLVEQSHFPRMILDFANVAYMSSNALGMLITLHKRVRERNGQLRLCAIQSAIYEVFVMTRLNEIFNIDQSRQQALEAMQA